MEKIEKRINLAIDSLKNLEGLNRMLALPEEYQSLIYGNRRPIQDHFGEAIFPIPSDFSIGFEKISIKRLAKALIEPDCLQHDLRYYYTFWPTPKNTGLPRQLKRSANEFDPVLVQKTLIRFMFYDYASLLNYRMPYKKLMAEVGKQTPGALFKLIQIDKTFMTGPYGKGLILKKQHDADWKFFEKLGKAVSKKPVDEPEYMFKAKLIAAYLWDDYFSKMPYPEMVRILKKEKVLPKNMATHNFKRMLHRHGLVKQRYNKKN